jgi:hypothetical protein
MRSLYAIACLFLLAGPARGAPGRPPSFPTDILPLLSKAGCNQGACHAKQGGRNGFQLSVLAYDPAADYEAVVRQAHGRRVDRQRPGQSLLLLKATMTLPHGGGRRIDPNSPAYRRIAAWVAAGAPFRPPGDPDLAGIEVAPAERVLTPGARLPLRVTARYSDGSRRDVTALADYKSNETGIAEVDERGGVRASRLAGEAAIMVRYLGQVAVCRLILPQPRPVPPAAYAALPRQNFIDELVYRKLARLCFLPSPPADDATFLRRVSLDLIGTLPTVEEARAFLAECEAERKGMPGTPTPNPLPSGEGAARAATGGGESPPPPLGEGVGGRPASGGPPPANARADLIARLLSRPEYADYWGMRWVNLLLVDRDPLFPKGAFAYDRWVRDAFHANMPFDRFATALLTASGETYRDGPVNFYRSLASPEERGKAVSQLFLGVRIDCAQCHHHPSERWGQDDYYAFAAFFARLREKGGPEFERVIFPAAEGEVKHPKTGAAMPPKPLGAPAVEVPDGEDRREYLARWLTAPDNPYFARTIVNRIWGLLMGRGLVEPVDDFRLTNPATNDPLLSALADDFVAHGYDLKHLLVAITSSAAYQRSSEATANNARDRQNYSRFLVKRLPAEVLLDAVGRVTAEPETFPGHPGALRAIQLWDNKLPSEFLEVFGRPSRLSVCECDRPADGSVTQVLHLMNSPAIQARLTADDGAAARLDRSGKPPAAIVEELYLAAYNRFPTAREQQFARTAFTREGTTRRAAIEDLLWVLLNSPEFVFNH